MLRAVLEQVRVVDLSAPLSEQTVLWPGEEPLEAVVLDPGQDDGSYSRRVSLPEHVGTHLDAPCHYSAGQATVAEIPVEQLVRPVCVIDISDDVGDDPDAELSVAQVERFEASHGRIPAGAAVFLRTGWERWREDRDRYAGAGDDLRFPAFGTPAAQLLVEQRGVVGLGVDSLGIDPGHAHDAPVHSQVSLPRGVWHLENLVNLALLPPTGAWVVVGVPKLVDGSGFPARVIALLP